MGQQAKKNFPMSYLFPIVLRLKASSFRAVYAFRLTWSERFLSRIRHRNELAEKAWEDAVQGLEKEEHRNKL